MTARGCGQRRWTAADYAYILENAGLVPAERICDHLGVSMVQLSNARRLINARGGNVTLRCFESGLQVCPSCGCRRSTVGRDGICEVCRKERRLASLQSEVADLVAALPDRERAVYERTQAKLSSSPGQAPMPPDPDGLDRYRAAKAEDAYDRAVERWASDYAQRRIKAAQKRKERIVKKLRRAEKSYRNEKSE